MSNTTVQRFETGISVNNLKNWSDIHAVKEFVQNAVYAQTVLGDEMSIKHDGKFAIINNFPSGFSKGKLLIGESEQSDVAGAPGQYGEGMKVAMAVARRLGMECSVETNGFTVRPELEPSSLDESVDTLTFYIEDHDSNNGTTFRIECSEEILEQAKASFAVLQGVKPEQVSEASIMTDMEGGHIYVNGVLVYDTPSVFSYNFTNADLMNRDRSTVDIMRVKREVQVLLTRVTDIGIATKIVGSVMKDDSLLEAQAPPVSTSCHEDIWLKAIHKHYGTSKIALSDYQEANTQAQYKRYKVISPNTSWAYFLSQIGVPYASDLAKVAKKTSRVHRKPTPENSQNLGWAKRLVKLYYGDYGTVKVSEDLHDEHGNKCLGLYDTSKDVTWLDARILSDKEELFKTLLHETIHRVSGAKDNTEHFTREWEQACWGILNKGRV
jgi:hypothetical protein